MARYAQITDGEVTLVFESSSPPAFENLIEITGNTDIAVGWKYADGVFSPPFDKMKAEKLAQIMGAAAQAEMDGILTSVGLTMKYGMMDCLMVDGVVRYSEMKGYPVVAKLVEADGAEHIGTVSLSDGKAIVIEQFEAAYAADERLRALLAMVEAATVAAELEAITWSMELSS